MIIRYGMYNVPHITFENDSISLNTDTVVGTNEEYEQLGRICDNSGVVIVEHITIGNTDIAGSGNIKIFDDSIHIAILPSTETEIAILNLTLSSVGTECKLYAEESSGGSGSSGVSSFKGRTGAVIPASADYSADMVSYDNSTSELIAENVQDAIDEQQTEIEGLADDLSELVDQSEYLAIDGATLTLYVDGTSGSDNNDGLTSGTAFATISKALAVPDSRYKIINVSGTLTESIITDGANCRIYIASGTTTLTLDHSLLHTSCRIEIANSTTAQAVVNFVNKIWYSADFYIHGWSSNKITISGLPYMVGSQLNIDYCAVTISSVVTTINSRLAVTNSNFTMGGYHFNIVASDYYFATVTLTGCGTNLFNNCRALLCSLNGLTHDATYLVSGTAVINYKNITGSVDTQTYNTSLIV